MKQVERYFYPAVFTYEPGQEIAVDFPDLKCATSGVNDDDALLSARELLGCVLYGLEEDAEEIPAPTPLTEVDTQPNERVVLVDVYMPSIRQAHVNRSVLVKSLLFHKTIPRMGTMPNSEFKKYFCKWIFPNLKNAKFCHDRFSLT